MMLDMLQGKVEISKKRKYQLTVYDFHGVVFSFLCQSRNAYCYCRSAKRYCVLSTRVGSSPL